MKKRIIPFIIMAYFDGTISGQDFIKHAKTSPEVAEWFQALVPPGADILDKKYIPYHINLRGWAVFQDAESTHPFWKSICVGTCFNCLEDRIDFSLYFKKTTDYIRAGSRLDAYTMLFSLAKTAYPDLQKSQRYDEEFDFYIKVCGDTYDSSETATFIDQTIMSIYKLPLSKTKRIAMARKALREMFHIEGNKRPSWIHGSLWPMGVESPMKYLSTKKDGEHVEYMFQDVITGEIKTIEDYY